MPELIPVEQNPSSRFSCRTSGVHPSGVDLQPASVWFSAEFLCTALKHSELVNKFFEKISIVRFDKKNTALQQK
jgi:hypothetical protein